MTLTVTYGWTQLFGSGATVNNVVTTGAQYQPAITRLGANGFATFWSDGATEGDVQGRLYLDPLSPRGDEFSTGSFTGLQSQPSATTLLSGDLLVAFTDSSPGGFIRLLTYSTAGIITRSYTTSVAGQESWPDVASLKDGGYVLTYSVDVGGGDSNIVYKVFNADGSLRSGNLYVDTSTALSDQHPSVAALTGGGFAIVYESGPIGGAAPSGKFQMFSPTGASTGAIVTFDTAGSNTDFQAIGLQDGGFAVAYTDDQWSGSDTDISLALFSDAGATRAFVKANATIADTQSLPSITQLDNGIVVVGWFEAPYYTGLQAFQASDGAPLGPEIPMAIGNNIETELLALSGGRLQSFRTSQAPDASGDQSVRIVLEELSRTIVGDAAADVFNGDSLNDRFTGGGGNDTFDGGAGFDTAVFSGARLNYRVGRGASPGSATVTDLRPGSPDGSDVVINVERLKFSDFSKPALLTLGSDYDGTGRSDLLFRDSTSGGLVTWDGARSSVATGLGGVGTEWSIVTGDLDGDNRTDIVFRNASTGGTVVWNGGQSSTARTLTAVEPVWKLLLTSDVDGDGSADLLFRNDSSGGLVLWKGGDSSRSSYLGGVGPEWTISAGDLDGNGQSDLIFRNGAGIVVWSGGVASTAHALTAVDPVWKLAATGDFDGDGKADLAFLNTSNGGVVTWSGGDSAQSVFRGVTTANAQVLAGDFNGDGISDVFLRDPNTGTLVIWDGAAGSTAHTVGGVGSEWQIFG